LFFDFKNSNSVALLARHGPLRFRRKSFLAADKIRVLSSAMSVDRSVFSLWVGPRNRERGVENTPRAASCKRAHDARGTNKLPERKRAPCVGGQHFDSARGFFCPIDTRRTKFFSRRPREKGRAALFFGSPHGMQVKSFHERQISCADFHLADIVFTRL
jgi:hypothetical protein